MGSYDVLAQLDTPIEKVVLAPEQGGLVLVVDTDLGDDIAEEPTRIVFVQNFSEELGEGGRE